MTSDVHCEILMLTYYDFKIPFPSSFSNFQETVEEIHSIGRDIDMVKERGQLIVDTPDSEGHKAMEATLTMLADRFNNLQSLADDKGKQLQVGNIIL